MIEQRAIATLGDDGNADLSEILAPSWCPPIGTMRRGESRLTFSARSPFV